MKPIISHLIIFVSLLIVGVGVAQTPEHLILSSHGENIILPTKIYSNDRKVILQDRSSNESSNTPKDNSKSAVLFGTTPANFSVSPSGAATYTIPIATPVGIRNISPNIGLYYNSQAGNDIAGWGWSISGLSAITRVPSTNFHDGYVRGIALDANDRFALDGQRLLLKSGTYGADGSTYETENYSNIKVKARIVGDNSLEFLVYHPNGSIVEYGSSFGARNKLQWNISKTTDPQGNIIHYKYVYDGNFRNIQKISFGHQSGSAPVEIIFHYKKRKRPEIAYVSSHLFERTTILDKIETKGNGELFRKYTLEYDETYLGYERLIKFQEHNKKNHSFSPITFSYGYASPNPRPDTYFGKLSSAYNYKKDQILSGEFNGDGVLDFILYNDSDKNNIRIFDNIYEASNGSVNVGRSYDVPEFDYILTNNMLNHDGKKLERQGITFVKEKLMGKHTKVEFKSSYSGAAGLYHQYTKTWNAPTSKYQYDCDTSVNRTVSREYVSGDFNGDGLTDVLALDTPIVKRICFWEDCDFDVPDDEIKKKCCKCEDLWEPYARAYFIDLNRNLTTDFTSNTSIREFIGSRDKVMAADFNGDGKTNLFHFTHRKVYIYELNKNNKLDLIHLEEDDAIQLNRPILLGDYNGDGKTEFITPTADDSADWRFFISIGNTITKYSKNINITYQPNKVLPNFKFNNGKIAKALAELKYIPQDVNGDGKTDIIKHVIVTANDFDYSDDMVRIYTNMLYEDDIKVSFKIASSYSQYDTGVSGYGMPIFIKTKEKVNNLEYAYISGNHLSAYKFEGDHRKSVTLERIKNSDAIYAIDYYNLTYEGNINEGIYNANYDEVYPYVNVNIAPSLKLVSKVRQSESNSIQDFRYSGIVTHAKGLGLLGFKQTVKSNIHGKDVERLWHFTDNNIQKRGVPTRTWTSINFLKTPDGYINKTDFKYETKTTPNKVFINVPLEIVAEDALVGVTTTKNIVYDAYYNPKTITTTYPDGSETVTQNYTNNPTPFNALYAIGRLRDKTVTKVLKGNTFTTSEIYGYDNNLVTIVERKGNGTPPLFEHFKHDKYGNIEQKKVTASGIADRVETFKYDPSGRFMEEYTNIEGLVTTYKYLKPIGKPFKKINPYGLATSYEYDDWGRIEKETNYLGRSTKTQYTYSAIFGGSTPLLYVNSDKGKDEQTYYNALGWVIRKGVLNVNNKWVYKDYKYDVAGKKIKESEPFFGGASPTKWNTYSYDEYGRPISQELFTGKTISTTYNGASITVTDGETTTTTTKDAVGNSIKVTDNGGTINYTYYANGKMKSANYNGHIVSVGIDGWGRKKSLTDPSAGSYTYKFNILGELLEETTPKGTTKYNYEFGRLLKKEIVGEHTNCITNYKYNPTTKLLENITAVNGYTNKKYNYNYKYDDYKRIEKITENNSTATFQKQLAYNAWGKIEKEIYTTTNTTNGVTNTTGIKNVYDNSGTRTEIRTLNTDKLLWKINEATAKGQALSISLGNGIQKTNTYNKYDYLSGVNHVKAKDADTPEKIALQMEYNFDAAKGVLKSRTNKTLPNWNESFKYNLNRLTEVSGAVTHKQDYDQRSRILKNSFVGTYSYDDSNLYRLKNINLNNQGDLYYQQNPLQQVVYNAFKKPVQVTKKGKGQVDFEYGPFANRTHAFYGGLKKDKNERTYHKQYSSIMPVEIIQNKATASTKIITYIGGDAYTAPIAHIKQEGKAKINAYHYLHRDYLGSILAITNANATNIEQRQFGAWGLVDSFKSNGKTTAFNHNSILSRGFTGHEHFFEVGLIHMNGRMYDAKLGRFLSPDNFVQEPFNTQSFNRYSYVWNNPLSYTDPGGEIAFLAVVAIGASIFGAANLSIQAANGEINNFWDGAKAFGAGALAGAAITAGVTAGLSVPILGSIIKGAGLIYGGTTSLSTMSGVGHGIFKGDWSKLRNTGKIFAGNFYFDSNRSLLGQAWQGMSRFSWELPQSTIGHGYSQLRNTFGIVDRVDYFGGATFSTSVRPDADSVWGVSLGHHISIQRRGDSFDILNDPLLMHEYGHTFDNQIFGLTYLLSIGIPSASGADWTERRANRHADRYFGNRFGVNWTPFVIDYPLNE